MVISVKKETKKNIIKVRTQHTFYVGIYFNKVPKNKCGL